MKIALGIAFLIQPFGLDASFYGLRFGVWA